MGRRQAVSAPVVYGLFALNESRPTAFWATGLLDNAFGMVPEVRLELTRLATKVFETSASAIPPLGLRKQA